MAHGDERIDRLRIREPESQLASRHWLWLAAAIAAVLAIGSSLWWWSSPGVAEVEVVEPRQVSSGNQARRSAVLDASGYVVARRQATVSAKVTGKIEEVLVEEGMEVEIGQVLARLDDVLDRSELALAQARLRAAESAVRELEVSLADARRTLSRRKELRQRDLASQSDVDEAETLVDRFEAQVQARRDDVAIARLAVELQQQRVDELTIRAPFSGVVVAKAAQPGEMVSPISAGGGHTRTGICTIVDMGSLEIEVDVNEAYIQRVSPKQPATAILDAYPNWEIPARVIAVVPTADRQRATVRVRVGFEETDARILPEMGVRVRFLEPDRVSQDSTPQPASGVLLPASVVHREEGRNVVYVVTDGRLERRGVQVAEQRDNEIMISAGVRAGEQVAAVGPDVVLRDRQRARIIRGETP
ncbi:efflux RND transporter periplasmic adaptor subunit [Wenzhouxiangella sp. AB-CW3]|uniref:efflux RND transporter periplasmic adaptor subunit n=1 Tax=Wenzhouxiangella sp. AB-CW3 TaxID=2771012 RepID=UPI00168AC432|nr:efflux RND transporter periplasmic adaptor subunit [Wenzhouxiangella sp. AB-CW3]QOC22400.1 efflux RND transporter periplasmic adaptor subunit [Wenzhouxiangella sp. AB-CW3]